MSSSPSNGAGADGANAAGRAACAPIAAQPAAIAAAVPAAAAAGASGSSSFGSGVRGAPGSDGPPKKRAKSKWAVAALMALPVVLAELGWGVEEVVQGLFELFHDLKLLYDKCIGTSGMWYQVQLDGAFKRLIGKLVPPPESDIVCTPLCLHAFDDSNLPAEEMKK